MKKFRNSLRSGIVLWVMLMLAACGTGFEAEKAEEIKINSLPQESTELHIKSDTGEGNPEDSGIQDSPEFEAEGQKPSKSQEENKEAEESQMQGAVSGKTAAGGKQIEDQTFQVTLTPLGKVTFASYEPDLSQNPLADVDFVIRQDKTVLQKLPGVTADNCRSSEQFNQVEAVSFLDYNDDGFDDIITICSYHMVSGPDAGTRRSEIRYYSGSEKGRFSYEEQMSADATEALDVITIQSAKDFIGVGRKAAAEDWRQAYVEYLRTDSDVEGQEGYVLIYLDNDDIPELVEIGVSEADGCRIVNFSKGKVHKTQLNRLYFSYIERGNLLCNSEGLMDCYYDRVYSLIDGEMTLIASGDYGAEDNSRVQFDEEGNPIYQYVWNGVKMSKEEYERALNSVYDLSRARDGYAWNGWYSVDEMIQVLEN
ncbi:MAG: hypothetical protein Q4C66_13900 [Lachnospiraceae bacterium]|nr:hypothetical protein [Lachnospiraceae bacterium]